jgi:ribonuclease T2
MFRRSGRRFADKNMLCASRARATYLGAKTMRVTLRTAVPAMLALVALLAAAAAPADARSRGHGEPGKFDFYVLSLSWSPSFCATPAGPHSPECGARPFAFVVHGLWPQYERGFPESCQVPPPRLARTIVDEMLDLMPAPKLVYHEWDKHGTCSGLDQRDYFDAVRKARAAVKIPGRFDRPQQPLNVAPGEIVDAFVAANQGLGSAGIAIDCDRKYLREIRVCMTRDLQFRECGPSVAQACRSGSVLMPPVRGP